MHRRLAQEVANRHDGCLKVFLAATVMFYLLNENES